MWPNVSRIEDAAAVGRAAQLACVLEVSAPKPGNITPAHDFADTTYTDMVRAGLALGPVMAQAGYRTVGELILAGVRVTRQVVPANTNLGIVLLLAPLARAAMTGVPVECVLADLGIDDANLAFAAITEARPGGLGENDELQTPARVGLREAMAAGQHRDSVASEYATGYEILGKTALPMLRRNMDAGMRLPDAIVWLFIGLLAEVPDTLIARKLGPEAARAISTAAAEVRDGSRSLESLDQMLRTDRNRLNPGTTADLVCATLFVAQLWDGAIGP